MRLMVATGLDGTLITHKGILTKYTEETLLNFRNQYDKNYLVVASSRGFQSIREYLKPLRLFKEDDYTICFNGCEIVHNKTGEVIYSRYIKGKDIKKGLIYQSFYHYNCSFSFTFERKDFKWSDLGLSRIEASPNSSTTPSAINTTLSET